MSARPTLVVFQGGASPLDSPLESYVLDAQRAATLDLLDIAGQTDVFTGAILVTEDSQLIVEANSINGEMPLLVESADDPFHFGEALFRVCKAHELERVVYAGGASLPLATLDTMRDLALAVGGDSPCLVANSLYSADFVAFYPASALDRISTPATDNNLAWLLHYTAGLPFAATPRALSTQFDIDTPPDLAVLGLVGVGGSVTTQMRIGNRLSRVLERIPEMMPRLSSNLANAYQVMATRRARVFLAGRISAWVWRRLEVNLPCETRVISEERGMQAGGRDARGEVRSLLGLHMDAVGLGGLVSSLEETCDAAFLDTRVLFAHRRLTVSRADRFYSDALQPSAISDPWVRDLTAALASAPIPIVLGGHSLVAGGVWALSEQIRASNGPT